MTTTDARTIQNMRDSGGSFVKALAGAMGCADTDNLARIKAAFPEIMDRYAPTPFLDDPDFDLAPPFGPDHPFEISRDQVGL